MATTSLGPPIRPSYRCRRRPSFSDRQKNGDDVAAPALHLLLMESLHTLVANPPPLSSPSLATRVSFSRGSSDGKLSTRSRGVRRRFERAKRVHVHGRERRRRRHGWVPELSLPRIRVRLGHQAFLVRLSPVPSAVVPLFCPHSIRDGTAVCGFGLVYVKVEFLIDAFLCLVDSAIVWGFALEASLGIPDTTKYISCSCRKNRSTLCENSG